MASFGELLTEARGERHQQEMADALDVSQGTISSWETGSHYPRRDRLRDVARAYGIGVNKLLQAWAKSGLDEAA